MCPELSARIQYAGNVRARINMFARAACIKVEPGCEVELTRILEQEVIPRFRREKDFRGLLAFSLPDGREALSLSLWDQKERWGGICARSFGALGALVRLALGKQPVPVYAVLNSAFHTRGQATDPGEVVAATPDLKIYESALQPFKVASARAARGRGFPLMWCLINSFHT